YVTGESYGSARDYLTIKYGPNGQQLWSARYDGPFHGEDLATAVVADNFGNVYVTGRSDTTDFTTTVVTIKYDPNGTKLWMANYGTGVSGYGATYPVLALDPMGNLFVALTAKSGNSSTLGTVKYSASGVPIWAATYDGPSGEGAYARAIAADRAGNIYV